MAGGGRHEASTFGPYGDDGVQPGARVMTEADEAPDLVTEPGRASARAQQRAGVEIRLLTALPEMESVYELFDRIWQPGKAAVPVTVEQMRAMTHAGNYLSGAFDGGHLVGACLGFFAAPPGEVLHSHVAGVDPAVQGRGVGFALKVHQRAWALGAGLRTVTWTFDPLIRRNAYFNLVKLGATARTYLANFYGTMTDAVNAGQDSDRLLLEWEPAAPAVARACAGEPVALGPERIREARTVLSEADSGDPVAEVVPATDPVVLVQVPADIVEMRRRDPEAGRRWRTAVRETLGGLLDDGGVVIGMTGSGAYVVESAS
jgi:predicted GNAT superfamily acetyltransferase